MGKPSKIPITLSEVKNKAIPINKKDKSTDDQIKVVMQDVSGTFDMDKHQITCVVKKRHGTVNLCFNCENSSMLIPFARIKLYDSNLAIDADVVFEDAAKLGNEIARRWNEADF